MLWHIRICINFYIYTSLYHRVVSRLINWNGQLSLCIYSIEMKWGPFKEGLFDYESQLSCIRSVFMMDTPLPLSLGVTGATWWLWNVIFVQDWVTHFGRKRPQYLRKGDPLCEAVEQLAVSEPPTMVHFPEKPHPFSLPSVCLENCLHKRLLRAQCFFRFLFDFARISEAKLSWIFLRREKSNT